MGRTSFLKAMSLALDKFLFLNFMNISIENFAGINFAIALTKIYIGLA